MYLVVGLGNPGSDYAMTRHNVGFLFLDFLAEQHGLSFTGSKWQAQVATARLWGNAAVLVKPETFMNRSGLAVSRIAAYYKVAPEQIVVIHDDLDLAVGRVKIMNDRGAGGHNGIRSLIEQLGTKSFPRFKIGIGRPQHAMPVERYVLANFASDEWEQVRGIFPVLEDGVRLFAESGIASAMNRINANR